MSHNGNCPYSGGCNCKAGKDGSKCAACAKARSGFEHCAVHNSGCHLGCSSASGEGPGVKRRRRLWGR